MFAKFSFLWVFDLIRTPKEIDYPSIFIVGLPRSGTTLFYQLIVSFSNCGYISNLASVFPFCPGWVSRFTGRYHSNVFRSKYGNVSGLNSPSEAAEVMRVWFERSTNKYANSSILKLKEVFQSSLVIKNVWNSYRIDDISKLNGKRIVLLIERDIYAVAKSILKAEKSGVQILSRHDSSIQIDAISFENVLERMVDWSDYLESKLKNCGMQVIRINYEEFCKSPIETLSQRIKGVDGFKFNFPTERLFFKASIISEREKSSLKASISKDLVLKASLYEHI